MKYKDLPIISISIAVLALAGLNVYIKEYVWGVILCVGALYLLTYMIIAIKREKRLESELRDIDRAYDIALTKNNVLIMDKEELEHDLKENRSLYADLYADFLSQVKSTDDLQKMYDNLINKEIPFNEDNDKKEELYLCPVCSKEMRQTKCYHICDNCNKRVKKSSYGVELIT